MHCLIVVPVLTVVLEEVDAVLDTSTQAIVLEEVDAVTSTIGVNLHYLRNYELSTGSKS